MKRLQKPVLALLLCCTLAVAGCSTAWVTTLDDILAAAAPALINILNIVAIAKGAPVNAGLEAKITADASSIKSLAANFATASTAAAPGVCAQLEAGINTYSADEAQVLALASVSDPATQAKIDTLSALVAGTVTGILAVIPSCQQVGSLEASVSGKSVPLPLSSFVKSYNAVLVQKTGTASIDAFTSRHKIHVHSGLVRVLSLGHAI